MMTTDEGILARYMQGTPEALQRLELLQDEDEFTRWLNEDALDVQVEGRFSLTVNVPRTFSHLSVHVLVSFGGPNIWWVVEDSNPEWVQVRGYWGTEDIVKRFYMPWVAAQILALVPEDL